jgi:hypothetical protein
MTASACEPRKLHRRSSAYPVFAPAWRLMKATHQNQLPANERFTTHARRRLYYTSDTSVIRCCAQTR